ncbi:transcriptional regulator, TetR family [[Actinomadura] parvosata subsp. kistnae]|uniref:TetR family transcriptional regulator n=2 Tax=Nonomuraea TaxID=83681 RepID=A0A1U9ZVV2_9ACTN|nr:TetR family transcriptional regulator [Nonomuraea sp. ATCC 55076]SPL89429.1 transcriptional regulator, TetR family [Actinomadura parvosata subsp. kistnae]
MGMRRRGQELEQAILKAAQDELLESGYAGLTMERVAKRAGTNKNALYRRWPHRAALGVAAYAELAATRTVIPDTGSLRGDVLALLRAANDHWSSPLGEILRGLLSAAGDDPELLSVLHARVSGGDSGAGMWQAVLRRAGIEVTPRVATVAMGLLRNEFVTRGTPHVPDDVLVEIVDEVYLPLVTGHLSSGAGRGRSAPAASAQER